jgi:hypothetical protein
MKTFWLSPAAANKATSVASSEGASSEGEAASRAVSASIFGSPVVLKSAKQERLVQWMVELLMEHMKKIVSDHRALYSRTTIYSSSSISLVLYL